MKKLIIALCSVFLFSQLAFAEGSACDAKAAEKKLAGAAKNSFLKKCERVAKEEAAKKDCEAKAADKKLKGAAKNSFSKKCIADATAPAAPATTK
jgi:hypothetical protein